MLTQIKTLIPFVQVGVSIVLIVLILLQERSAGGLGGLLGGGESSFYQTRRGLEKLLFVATIVLAILFAGLALLNLVL